MKRTYKLIPAIIAAVIVYVVFLLISIQLNNYAELFGIIHPFAWLAPIISLGGIVAAIIVFVIIMVMWR
jgi:hypothetical protein